MFLLPVSFKSRQVIASNILNNGTANSTILADALSLYIQATANANESSSNTVSASTIDNVVTSLSNVILVRNTTSSFLMVQPVNQSGSIIVLGASFDRGSGGNVVTSGNTNIVTNASVSTAAVLTNQSLTGVTYLNMLIVDKPSLYTNIDNSTDNKSLASSVIVAAVQRSGTVSAPINISLYFTVLPEYQPNVSATYLCSFYDTINFIWNETGCTSPEFNAEFDRYECSCDHLTSFALTWAPSSISGLNQTTTSTSTSTSASTSTSSFTTTTTTTATTTVTNNFTTTSNTNTTLGSSTPNISFSTSSPTTATNSAVNVTLPFASVTSNTMEPETTFENLEIETSVSSTITITSTSLPTTMTSAVNVTLPFASFTSNTMERETTFENLEIETSVSSITTIISASLPTTTASTHMSSVTTSSTSSISTTTSAYTPNSCNSSLLVALENGTCVANNIGQVC